MEFPKGSLKLGKQVLNIEIAETKEQRAHGLMHRTSLPENYGMLFVFEEEQFLSFWMKNTYVDLSIAYFDSNRLLFEIIDMKASSGEMQTKFKTYPSSKTAKYALEVPLGWFKKHKIRPGLKFEYRKIPKKE